MTNVDDLRVSESQEPRRGSKEWFDLGSLTRLQTGVSRQVSAEETII